MFSFCPSKEFRKEYMVLSYPASLSPPFIFTNTCEKLRWEGKPGLRSCLLYIQCSKAEQCNCQSSQYKIDMIAWDNEMVEQTVVTMQVKETAKCVSAYFSNRAELIPSKHINFSWLRKV